MDFVAQSPWTNTVKSVIYWDALLFYDNYLDFHNNFFKICLLACDIQLLKLTSGIQYFSGTRNTSNKKIKIFYKAMVILLLLTARAIELLPTFFASALNYFLTLFSHSCWLLPSFQSIRGRNDVERPVSVVFCFVVGTLDHRCCLSPAYGTAGRHCQVLGVRCFPGGHHPFGISWDLEFRWRRQIRKHVITMWCDKFCVRGISRNGRSM